MSQQYAPAKATKSMKEMLEETEVTHPIAVTKVGKTVVRAERAMKPLPKMPPKPKPEEINKLIVSVPCFVLTNSVECKRVGPRDLMIPKGALLSSMMSWTHGNQDGAMFNMIQTVGIEQNIPNREISRVLDVVDSCCWSGGTVQGLYNRLKYGASLLMAGALDLDRQVTVNWLLEKMPVDHDGLPNLAAMTELNVDEIRVNYKTRVGYPFLGTVKKHQFSAEIKPTDKTGYESSVAKIWFAFAKAILAACVNFETFKKYFKENEDLFTAILCNKYSLMKREDILTKVRPYYLFPAAPSLLAQAYVQPLQDHMKNYVQDKKSWSALKHNWANGGLRRLQRWVRDAPQGFSAIVYGDDILAIFKEGDHVLVMAPDAEALDMSLVSEWQYVYAQWVLKTYKEKMSERWRNVVSMHMKLGFEPKITTEGTITVTKTGGFCSGKVGTTIVDMVAVISSLKEFKDDEASAFGGEKKNKLQIVQAWSDAAWVRIRQKFGLKLKASTGLWVEWDFEKDPLPVPFLGYVGKKLKMSTPEKDGPSVLRVFWVPAKPAEDWFKNLCYVRRNQKEGRADNVPLIVLRLSALFGIYFSGGYVSKWVAEAIRRLYRMLCLAPGAAFSWEDADLDEFVFNFAYLLGAIPWLPSRFAMASFYDEEKEMKLEDLVRPYEVTGRPKPLTPAQKAAVEAVMEEKSEMADFSLPIEQWDEKKASKKTIGKIPAFQPALSIHVGKIPPQPVVKVEVKREERVAKGGKQLKPNRDDVEDLFAEERHESSEQAQEAAIEAQIEHEDEESRRNDAEVERTIARRDAEDEGLFEPNDDIEND